MNVEVKFLSVEATTSEVEKEFTGNSSVVSRNNTDKVKAHKVKLDITFDEETSFVFTHTVHPVKSTDASIITAQAALMNFAVALQKRLNKPIN